MSPKKAGKKVKKTATRKKIMKKTAGRRTPARSKVSKKTEASGPTIHCTLAPTGGWAMVLPTSAIVEITDYAPPAPLENTPEWLLGQVEWEDWQVPVISYGALIEGDSPESATAHSRIMVVKSLSSTARLPFIGVMVSDIPKLANIAETEMEITGDEGKSLGVHCKVKFSGQNAVIPDLDRLSQLVSHAAYGTIDKEGAVAEA
jgi:chemosensory pili system protein ChpC